MTDLIKQVGGLQKANDIINNAPPRANWYQGKGKYSNDLYSCNHEIYGQAIMLYELRQAIADYNTDHCSDIGNHLSPSTKIINK